jgi:S-adenosyl-L-methionine hydrolase (adenosine-forming)
MAIITLLTDFGLSDTYVGQVKGVLLSIDPQAQCVDLSHGVPAQDVRTGAFLLWSAVEAFPAGSIHLAVVDPGVGSSRRPIAVRSARGDAFVGPDNGVLVPAVERLGGNAEAVVLDRPAYWRPRPSSTFHGRDIFAPVAARLANGVPLKELGSLVDRLERPFEIPQPRWEGAILRGEVVHVDGFGNLVTNIHRTALPPRFDVEIRGRRIAMQHHYEAAGEGELLALLGSSDLLEVSVRRGNAAAVLQANQGEPVVARPG